MNKLFPLINNYNNLLYDTEGLYSITNYVEANLISDIILSNFNPNNYLKILDGTGGLGGNTISFAKKFKSITSIELNNNRFKMLKNNIKQYKLNVNLLNINCIDYIKKNLNTYDIYFFDPPWGGVNYKEKKSINLKLDDLYLYEIVNLFKNKLIVFKIPFNYNLNEFKKFNYKLYKINKYYIILIYV